MQESLKAHAVIPALLSALLGNHLFANASRSSTLQGLCASWVRAFLYKHMLYMASDQAESCHFHGLSACTMMSYRNQIIFMSLNHTAAPEGTSDLYLAMPNNTVSGATTGVLVKTVLRVLVSGTRRARPYAACHSL